MEDIEELDKIYTSQELIKATSGQFDIVNNDPSPHVMKRVMDYFQHPERKEAYKDVPEFMIRDIFKLYYTNQNEMQFDINDFNKWWLENLQSMDNYLLKTITEEKQDYSFIITKHLAQYLAKQIKEDPNFTDKMQNGDGMSEKQKQKMQNQMQQGVQQAMENAKEEIKENQNMEKLAGEGDGCGKESIMDEDTSFHDIEKRKEILGKINISKSSLGSLITKSIQSMKKGLGCKTKIFEEEFMDAEEAEDITDAYLLLHKATFPDLTVTEHQSVNVKFDVYVDCSGSMSSGVSYGGESISRTNLAIALTIRLHGMNVLNDIYPFENHVHKKIKGIGNAFKMKAQGGTRIEAVMEHIKKTGNPSVIITDGEDSFQTDCPNAFLMLLSDYENHIYKHDALVTKMIKSKRYIQFANNKLFIPKIKQK